jgi:hypothetical protein
MLGKKDKEYMYLFVSRDQRTIDTLKLNGLAYVGKTTGQMR